MGRESFDRPPSHIEHPGVEGAFAREIKGDPGLIGREAEVPPRSWLTDLFLHGSGPVHPDELFRCLALIGQYASGDRRRIAPLASGNDVLAGDQLFVSTQTQRVSTEGSAHPIFERLDVLRGHDDHVDRGPNADEGAMDGLGQSDLVENREQMLEQ